MEHHGRFKAKHPWPPSFENLSQSERYRYERKYKRRVRLATARPAWWMRTTGLLQLATITVFPVYFIFFHDYGEKEDSNPFRPAKLWLREQLYGVNAPLPPRGDVSSKRQQESK